MESTSNGSCVGSFTVKYASGRVFVVNTSTGRRKRIQIKPFRKPPPPHRWNTLSSRCSVVESSIPFSV